VKIINNWSFKAPTSPYLPPEMRAQVLVGDVARDDGTIREVVTSRVVGVESPDVVVTFSGSKYQLGIVDPAYEALYPGAKERIMVSGGKLKNE